MFHFCRINQIHTAAVNCFFRLSTAGSFDISTLPESKGQAPKTGEMPAYVNTQQIDAQVLAALQAEAENVTKGMAAAAAKESPQKDLFDMSEYRLVCVLRGLCLGTLVRTHLPKHHKVSERDLRLAFEVTFKDGVLIRAVNCRGFLAFCFSVTSAWHFNYTTSVRRQ